VTQRDLFVRHASAHPRGYWREGEKRFGSTAEDPPRYKKLTVAKMNALGGDSGFTTNVERISDELYADRGRALREIAEHGAKADEDEAYVVTRHTLLGRMRENKQLAYEHLKDAITLALEHTTGDPDLVDEWITSWEHLDTEVWHNGRGGWKFGDGAGGVFAHATLKDINRAYAEATGESLAYAAAEAADLIDQLSDLGLTPGDLGLAVDAAQSIDAATWDQVNTLKMVADDLEDAGLSFDDLPDLGYALDQIDPDALRAALGEYELTDDDLPF
jgi:hypothetical protein